MRGTERTTQGTCRLQQVVRPATDPDIPRVGKSGTWVGCRELCACQFRCYQLRASRPMSVVEDRAKRCAQADHAHVLAELKAWIEGEDMIGGGEDGVAEDADVVDMELRALEEAARPMEAYPSAAALEQLQAVQADAATLATRLEMAEVAADAARQQAVSFAG